MSYSHFTLTILRFNLLFSLYAVSRTRFGVAFFVRWPLMPSDRPIGSIQNLKYKKIKN